MKRIITTTLVALAVAGFSGAAMAKAHNQPAAPADMGQEVAAKSAKNADARGLDGSPKGVVGPENAQDQKAKETPPTAGSTAGPGR
jgi:hypothetical protein